MPKQSSYNHFQKWNEDFYIAYNARSGAVALMTPDHYSIYKDLIKKLDGGQDNGLSEEEEKLLGQLKYGKFVCGDDFDEKRGIQLQHNVARYNMSSLGLVIAPTMACNMACEYCYEANKSGKIGEDQKAAIVKFVEDRGKGITSLSITWYGGEPLLATDVIEELSEKFLKMGEELHFDYSASIVTNGYLMTPAVADRLAELKVKSAQVTLDGPSELHNVKRPLKNGRDSFKTIIDNIRYAADKMSVSVRVNIDRSFTTDIISKLLDELVQAGLRDRVLVNFGHLDVSTQVCANIAESCFEVFSFSKVEADFYRLLLERGFGITKLPSPSSVACMAQTLESFVVDPDGELYKCWNYVGDKERSMGNIKDKLNYQHPNFLRLYEVHPFKYANCLDCNILPLCMGACPSRRIDRDLPENEICESWKYNLEPMLEIIAASRQQEMQKAQQKSEAGKSAEEKA